MIPLFIIGLIVGTSIGITLGIIYLYIELKLEERRFNLSLKKELENGNKD